MLLADNNCVFVMLHVFLSETVKVIIGPDGPCRINNSLERILKLWHANSNNVEPGKVDFAFKENGTLKLAEEDLIRE